MTVREAVLIYVAVRRAEGVLFKTPRVVLLHLCKTCGETCLPFLSSERLSLFVNDPALALSSRRSVSVAINGFVDYWSTRGAMAKLVVQKPQRQLSTLAPYIYTVQQVQAMLEGSEKCQRKGTQLTGSTLRAILMTMYATGATVNDVLSLRISGVHPRRRLLTFEASPLRPQRSVPICAELHATLRTHVRSTSKPRDADAALFRYRLNTQVTGLDLCRRFRRLSKMLQLPNKPDGRAPRMMDLRYTFAVHRLTSWIRQKADLNELVPALSMYMGYTSLTAAEQFLAFVPERFKDDLEKLSSSKGRHHWRNNPALLASLAAM